MLSVKKKLHLRQLCVWRSYKEGRRGYQRAESLSGADPTITVHGRVLTVYLPDFCSRAGSEH